MAVPTQKNGVFSWHELMTDNVEGAKAFYGALLGWRFETTTDAGIPYTHASIEGEPYPVAGLFDRSYAMGENAEQIPPNWGNYIAVADVNATAERVRELGGKIIVPPTNIPNVGRFSVVQDPQGAVVSLITYVDEPMT